MDADIDIDIDVDLDLDIASSTQHSCSVDMSYSNCSTWQDGARPMRCALQHVA